MNLQSINVKETLQSLAVQFHTSLKSLRTKLPNFQRRRIRRIENLWLLCWLLKDLGWVLLCGFVAWPAALLAIAFQAQDVWQQTEFAPVKVWVHSLATLAWLCGSSIWMTAQLLYEPVVHKNRVSPWYSGSIFTANADRYHFGVHMMESIHIITLLGLSIFYLMRLTGAEGRSWDLPWTSTSWTDPTGDAIRQRRAALEDDELGEETSSQVLVFGIMTPQLYSKVFIVPWIIKDLFWCHQSFIPAIVCLLLATVLMADYLWLFRKWRNLAVLLWTTGTAVWLSNDLIMHESESWPLMLTLVLLALAIYIVIVVIIARPPYDDKRSDAVSKDEVVSML